jgi:Legume lectin domain/Chitobiase/beta-hexosaminidase C-terminal domain/Bacterial lectin
LRGSRREYVLRRKIACSTHWDVHPAVHKNTGLYGFRRFWRQLMFGLLVDAEAKRNIGKNRYANRIAAPAAVLAALAFAMISVFAPSRASAQASVTTYHNDIGRTGQNLNETILNTANVNPTQFGKLFAQPVDGQIYAEPLYLSGITVNGAAHNVVFVETQNASVYAFDADSNGGANSAPLWQASMLSTAHGAAAGETTVKSTVIGYDIQPQISITGTPVIDPVSGTLYLVSASMQGTSAVQRLHALDVTTGLEKFGGPVVITATVPGTGNGSVNGSLSFDPLWQSNRPGLLLLNGIVWLGFGSHNDNGPWHGWVIGYNAATLQQTGAFCTSPNGTGAGIWMSGGGLAADQLDPVNHPFGRMFIPTGNGDYNATTMDYGDSHLNLDLTNGVPTVQDEFTTNQQAKLDSEDVDVASGGLMIIPTQTTGNYPHLAIQAGKAGTIFLLNRENLGGYNLTADQIAQELPYAVGNVGAWSSPAWFNGSVYYMGEFDNLKSIPLVNGQLSTTPAKSSEQYGYPGATPSISANGTSQGVVWTVNAAGYSTPSPAILQAHLASNVSTTLYSSDVNAGRDSAGNADKFAVPTVVNGKVYVGTASELDIYGLLDGITQTSAPSITPGTETYIGTLSVSITDTTPNASIYYSTDGSAATTASTLYTGPFTVATTQTVNAIATANGLLTSSQTSASYTNLSQSLAVNFSLPTGTYGSAQTVSLSDASSSAIIYYTTDGSAPTTASTVYTAPIAVATTETISAIAVAPGLATSPVISNTYTIILGATGINFGQGFASSGSTIQLNGSAQLNDTRLQITSGLNGQAGSGWYKTAVNIQSFTNDFTFQLSNPVANGMTFTIQNGSGAGALGGNGSAMGYAPIANSVAIKFDFWTPVGGGTNSTGLYVNGAMPTTPAVDLTGSGINLLSGDEMAAHMVYDGATLTMTITDMVTGAVWSTSWSINIPSTVGANTAYVGFTGSTGGYAASQKIMTWSFVSNATVGGAVATPVFSPAGGSFSSVKVVTISDTTPGAIIYFTTNGSTPTTSSTVYSEPITVGVSETINAIAVEAGFTNSAVGTANFVIASPAATPTFSPVAGTYPTAQTVTISDTTPGAAIYYTTNGATPTTSSALYSVPITISASETVNAIAAASGYTSSAVGTAIYTISSVTAKPAISPVPGVYTSTQTVTISDNTQGAVIYYTVDGSTPTTSSTVYSGGIPVSATTTVNAIAVAPGFSASPVASAAYTITTVAPSVNYSTGFTSTGITLNGASIVGGLLQLTNGGTIEQHSAWATTPVNIQAFTTDFTFQQLNASADGMTFAIQESGLSAIGGNGAGLGYYGITPSIAVKFDLYSNAGEGSDSTGFYTNGVLPTVPALDMTSSGVSLHSGDTMHAHITYDGTTMTLVLTDTVTNASFTASKALNLPSIFGANTAYVGFTGGTGGSSATQNVLTWAYTVNTPASIAAPPTFSPAAGTYSSAQTVTISETTTGATVYYTTDGSNPTTSSTVYSGPITVGATETVQAIAAATGLSNSTTASAAYTITAVAATPTFTPVAGTYSSAQTVTIGDTTTGATIYYTTNGSMPSTSSTVYSAPITVSTSETLKAIATATGFSTSAVGSSAYSITTAAATPTFTPAAGTYSSAQTVTISNTTTGATIYYTTNGSTPTTSSTVYSAPITVSASETVNAIATAPGFGTSATGTAAYVIQGTAPMPTFLPAAGTYTGTQTVTISEAISGGATIYYTTNGSTPTTSSAVYSGPITVSATETLNAIAVATGYTTSATGSATYTILTLAAMPMISPAAGTYASAQTVTISDTTTGATIYYTTNGIAPTTSSAVYSAPINVSASETVQAIAAGTGLATSSVATAAYTITTSAAMPSFLPAPGTYTSTQTVALSDATPGATIYYTTNGTAPTTSSTVYAGPITVGTTQTIQAIATATGFNTSGTAAGAYTITLPASTPLIAPAGGTFTTAQTVTITNTTSGATIYYTTNGTTPTTSSAIYAGPFAVSATETVEAIAAGAGYSASPAAIAAFTITPPAATPTFTPAAGSYTTAQVVTIRDTTPGATIYYTTNGSAPTASSTVYSGPITVAASETINAAALASGFSLSPTGGAAYSITPPAAAPTFSPATGTYTTAQTVTISDLSAGATIYYTTNGSTPTTASAVYSGPITVSATETLNAIAAGNGFSPSSVGSAAYTITSVAPVINFPTAFSTTGLNLVGSSVVSGALQVTDGGSGEGRAAWFTKPVNVQAFTTDFNFQQTAATADGMTFTLQNSGPGIWAVGGNGFDLGYGTIANSIAVKFDLYSNSGEGNDSTGFYTNGAMPTVPSVDMTSSGVNLHSGDVMHAHITYDGTTLTLTITDTVTSATFTTSTVINIPSVIGSNTAYAGFTGGTGGLAAKQSVLTWTYVPSSAAATPSFAPVGGTYISAQTVTISDTTPGATIYYTTNGSTPTSSSATYSAPINVSANETINAVALATGSASSSVGSASYTITPPAAVPGFSIAAGSYPAAQSVALSDSTTGAVIYYTTNGATPTTASSVYSAPISVNTSETINAIAVAPGFSSSALATAAYTITITASPAISPAAGTYLSAQTVTISDTTAGATIYYTTNGTTPTNASAVYSAPITVSSNETVSAIAQFTGYSASGVAAAAYVITPPAATPGFSPAGGSYTGPQSVTISDTTPGATIYYTTNGSTPTTASAVYAGAITVSGSETVNAIAVASGFSSSTTGSAAYTITTATATPVFLPVSGTYIAAQSVIISDTTAGATIYYTTNGATPTTSSAVYSAPIAVNASETLNAIAVATGFSQSATGTGAYTITPPAAIPTFLPAAGSYTATQTVTISDATPGAIIYYTTDGSTPTSSSNLYSGAITVAATETVTAIAVASGYSASSLGIAPYTIGAAPPVINFPSTFTATGLNLVGSTIVGGALQLTNGGSSEQRAAWYTKPVSVAGFTTDFNFQQTSAGADGMTFTLQNSGPGISAIGGNGASLGYGNITNSVAIKFDLYSNAGEGSDSTGFYTNGAVPTTPSIDMTSSGINLHSGDIMHAHITYDGTTLTLLLTDTVTNASFTTSQAINIPSVIGSSTAYAGFTAGTGGLTAIQNVLSWTYSTH